MPMQSQANKGSDISGATDRPEGHSLASKRRRLIRAGASGAAVLLAVKARTALGQTACLSPSAVVSGNMSAQPGLQPCNGGASPTVWKLQSSLVAWSAALAQAPELKPSPQLEDTTLILVKEDEVNPKSVIKSSGTRLTDVLPGATRSDIGIWEFLAFPDNDTQTELKRHLIAAWLNAGFFPDYPIKRWQVREMWDAVRAGGYYCPSSLACEGGMGMSANDIVAYISGMYESDSELKLVCKKRSYSTTSATSPLLAGG